MSIIYDALKKIERSNGLNPTLKIKDGVEGPRLKNYLLYALVVLLGFSVAIASWKFFTKALKVDADIAFKNLSRSEEKQQARIPVVLPQEQPVLAADILVSSETKKESPQQRLTLNGVFFSQDEGYALVNNQILQEGDMIEGATLKRIALDGIELEYEGSVINLSAHR